jgi:hypothetical protein
MAIYDLTTLANLKNWIGSVTTPDEILLQQLITQTSRLILNSLNRGSLLPLTYNEAYDGNDGIRLFIKNWPVIAINSLTIDGIAIPVSPPFSSPAPLAGYVLDTVDDPMPPGDMQQISLRSYQFTKGVQNVILNYSAGYQTTKEPHTIPGTPFQVAAGQPYGAWATDQGVTYGASGIALVAVPATPAAGQYSVAAGLYTFAAADSGASVLISYGFTPADLSLACQQWAGELYAYRGHIGVNSKSLGGQETVAFDTSAIPKRVDLMLQPYRRTVPI